MKNKNNKKSIIKYIIFIVICGLIGTVGGGLASSFDQSLKGVLYALADISFYVSDYLMIVCLMAMGVATAIFFKGKKLTVAAVSGEEELLDKAEIMLEKALSITSITMIIAYVSFGVYFSGFWFNDNGNLIKAATVFVMLVVFVGWLSVLQYKIIKYTKILNPEKRGNVLETNFQKEWFDSCDEAEKHLIGKAAYASYKALNIAFIVCFVVCVVVSTIVPIGPFPMLLVGFLWLVQTYTYIKVASKK